ncbi:MAG: DUF4838 domain-containing protein [Armatimonadota bacterium]|nr:DUF4838 domain-containing protein [Armatimonadota bacterium]
MIKGSALLITLTLLLFHSMGVAGNMEAEIVTKGKTNWRIVNVSDGEVCKFAAGELQRYLKEISGCELPIGSGDGPAIVLGLRTDLSSDDDMLLPDPAVGFDGYALAITSDKIVVGGDNERGVVYGVYDLLERIGCRWFYPQQDPKDVEVVPRLSTVRLEVGKTAIASPIEYRICNASSFFFEVNPSAMKAQLDVAMKARYNGMGWQCDHRTPVGEQYKQMEAGGVIKEIKKRGMILHGPAHSYPHFLPNDLYNEHPEWFGMRNGKRVKQEFAGSQFCLSNPEARQMFIKNAEKFVLESPGLDIFCPLPFDGGQFCECPECSKSTPADLMFVLMNELIERLSVSAPKLLVETYGGYNPKEPPEKVKPHPKLRIIWAHWGRYHGYGYDDARYDLKDNLEKWRKSAPGGFTLCQYYTDNFATPWISAPYAIVIKGDRRYILSSGVKGVYVLHWAKGYWWNHGLNSYMAGRCFYDVSLDPYDLIRDYAVYYFGENAGPLLSAYYTQWATNIDLPYHVRDGTSESDRKLLAEQRRLWINPAVEAVKDDPLLSHRVGKVDKLHRVAEMLAEAHRMREEVAELRKAGDIKGARKLLEKAKAYTDEVLAYMASVADLGEGLIDRNEVSGFITLGVKRWIEEEEKAIGGIAK